MMCNRRHFLSPVIPMLHQLHVLSRAIAHDHNRYLLADEVGIGKTIEAGLIMSFLKLCDLVTRTLLVAPNGLLTQWVVEMRILLQRLVEFNSRAIQTTLERRFEVLDTREAVIVYPGFASTTLPLVLKNEHSPAGAILVARAQNEHKWRCSSPGDFVYHAGTRRRRGSA